MGTAGDLHEAISLLQLGRPVIGHVSEIFARGDNCKAQVSASCFGRGVIFHEISSGYRRLKKG